MTLIAKVLLVGLRSSTDVAFVEETGKAVIRKVFIFTGEAPVAHSPVVSCMTDTLPG